MTAKTTKDRAETHNGGEETHKGRRRRRRAETHKGRRRRNPQGAATTKASRDPQRAMEKKPKAAKEAWVSSPPPVVGLCSPSSSPPLVGFFFAALCGSLLAFAVAALCGFLLRRCGSLLAFVVAAPCGFLLRRPLWVFARLRCRRPLWVSSPPLWVSALSFVVFAVMISAEMREKTEMRSQRDWGKKKVKMENNRGTENRESRPVIGSGRKGLAMIQTQKKSSSEGVCHDDIASPLRAQTIDELHSLQKKKSAPNTPSTGAQGAFASAFATISEEDRQKQQLQSISASLASLTRETGPKVVRGDPAGKKEGQTVTHSGDHHYYIPSLGISDSALKFTHVLYNLSPAELYEQAIKYEKGTFITASGALATLSGAKTGRSPRDKRVVKDETTEDELWWGKGSPNIEMDEHTFLVNRERAVDYLNSLDKVFVNDQFLNWDPEHRIKVRIVSARAYHSLFMHNMCIRPTAEELETFGTPDFTIYNAGQFPCNRYTHYMTSSTSIDLNLARREMVILGTQYAGEMKKGLFSVMHYLMPKRQILSLHSGCNMGKGGDVALFFGLSGTGKTTLSTDHNRYLIGDDEHCWSENGVSNIEGGCYAKCVDLSQEKEPDIWNAIKFGTVVENIVFEEHTREVDYSDKSVTGLSGTFLRSPGIAGGHLGLYRLTRASPVTISAPPRLLGGSPGLAVSRSPPRSRSRLDLDLGLHLDLDLDLPLSSDRRRGFRHRPAVRSQPPLETCGDLHLVLGISISALVHHSSSLSCEPHSKGSRLGPPALRSGSFKSVALNLSVLSPSSICTKLKGSNYLQWSRAVLVFLTGRGKESYLTTTKPTDATKISTWIKEDAQIMTWLWNSLEPDVFNNVSYLESSKDIWDTLHLMYSSEENITRIHELYQDMFSLQQGDRSIEEYFSLLQGMWDELNTLNPIRSQILSGKDIPTVRETYARVRRAAISSSGVKDERSALVGHYDTPQGERGDHSSRRGTHNGRGGRGGRSGGGGRGLKKCTHCGRTNHTVDFCWKLHGKPAWANHATVDGDNSTPSEEQVLISKAEYDSILQRASSSSMVASGTVSTPNLTFSNVLYLPEFPFNLLSVHKLTVALHCSIAFFPSYCVFQDLKTKRTIGGGFEKDGLYYFRPFHTSIPSALRSSVSPYQWHCRLGHPSFLNLQKLVPSLSDFSSFNCETCELSKHHRATFKLRNDEPCLHPFELVHSDVWGPARTTGLCGARYFVTFIDDHSRLTWVYVLKDRSQLFATFQSFYAEISNQFNAKLLAFRTDNAREYTESSFQEFLTSRGIIHQTSCVRTPQQNGIAERKNGPILAIARALMLQMHVPKSFWADAVLTATYLLNRMPSRVLKGKSPFEILFADKSPFSVPLKVFGCVSFVHNLNPSRDKLDPRAHKCIFLGYSRTQKGRTVTGIYPI
uniref:phosphoenolpyruvate carboxykinase (ATP) n=1 Tax=Fagus sylvatica TaxID=28930 RepID=A0A2N9EUA1_FAGSY